MTSGDLVTVTADGIDLNALWGAFNESTMIYNEAMDDLIALLTYLSLHRLSLLFKSVK